MDSGKIWKLFIVFLVLGFTPLSAAVSQVDVLVVADGHRLGSSADVGYSEGMFEDVYRDSFESVDGVEVDIYETNRSVDGEQFGPSADTMSEYDAVVWYTLADYGQIAEGSGWTTLYEQDINNITEYLDQGGSLYLNGHLIHIDLGREDFYSDYLQTEYREGGSPSYWRFKGDNLQQGLKYEWFFTYNFEEDYAGEKEEMDRFVDPDEQGIEKKGEGHFKGPISWHTYDYGQKPDYLYDNYFSWKASGLIYIPEDGTYEFGIDSDDAADILINGEKVVGWYDDHGIAGDYDSHKGDKTLSQGLHEFTVRMQEYDGDDGVSIGWKKPGDGSFTTVPEDHFYRKPSWKYDGIEARSYDEGEMVYNQDGDLKLSSSGGSIVSGDGMTLGLNTSIEPPESFGVISDSCHHEEDIIGKEGERRCQTANDALAWQNDIQVSGGSETVIHLEDQKRGDFWLDGDVTFDYTSSGGSDSVLLLGLTLDSAQSNREIQDVSYGGERMTQIHSVEGSDGNRRTQTFYLKDPPQGDHSIEIGKEGGSPDVLVNVLTFDGVNEANPIGDTSKGSEENSVGTTVSSEPGDLVIDFMASGGGGFEEGYRQRELFENWEDWNAYYQQGSIHPGEESVSMGWWSGDSHTAHSVINLNAASGKGKYYVETDGDSPSSYDYPDEFASGLVEGLQQNYRTVHTTFGLEAVKSQSSRRKLARNIVGFLAGPLTKNTKASSGENIEYTSVDESKYTNSSFNLTSTVFYRQDRNDTIVNARYMVSGTSVGLEPVLQDGFESSEVTSDLWDRSEEEESIITGRCGAKKGDLAYALRTDDSGGDPRLVSPTYDLADSRNLTLEFWLKIPSSDSSCDDPNPNENDEDLYVEFYSEDEGWVEEAEFKAQRESAKGKWEKIEVKVPERFYQRGFQFKFSKGNADALDTYLIDEVELDREILPVDDGRFYDDENYTVEVENIDATALESNLDSMDTGVNVTYAVQFKDGTRQGYWGLKGEDWLKVDTVAPEAPGIEFSRDYVNDEMVEVEVKHGTYSVSKMPNMTRLSCDQNSWSRWKERDVAGDQQLVINITSDRMNCGQGTGTKTVYAQFRDYAGNKPSKTTEDSIVYDTQKPEFEGIGPDNETAINLAEEFILNASDSFGILTTEKSLTGGTTYENVYNDGDGNSSLTINQTGGLNPFDQEDSGNSSMTSYVFDKALNLRKNYFEYDVDTEAPVIQRIEAGGSELSNNSALRPSEDISFELEDRNFREAFLNGGGGNQTFSDKSFEFDAASWSSGYQLLELWAKDDAGNVNHKVFNYTVDDKSPSVSALSHENSSYILNTTSVAFNFTDDLSGVLDGGIGVSEEVSRTSGFSDWGISVEPVEDSEGVKVFDLTVSDRAGNSINPEFEYIVDTEAPHVFTPYSNSGSWIGSNTTVDINATDDRNISTISYCVDGISDSCDLSRTSDPGSNVTVSVGCREGDQCRKSIRFEANDSAGNLNGTFETDKVLIDKKSPQADIQGPGQGSTVGAEVDLETEITDSGSGVRDVNYTVYNASNSSQVFDSGDLNFSKSYDAVWDSRDEINAIESVIFNITAKDEFGNKISAETQFEVDNSETSVTIERPYREYVNDSFRLIVDARRPGDRVISTHNYSIYNSSGDLVYSGVEEGIDSSNHRINLTLESSDLGSDGNYTLNSSASDNETGSANASVWFVLDTEAPRVSLDESLNNSWQTGMLEVDYTASENRAAGSLYASYKNSQAASWTEKLPLGYGGNKFNIPTGEYCEDSAQNKCFIRILGKDKAGNVNTSVVQFKVDNTDPSSNILSPPESTWQNNSFDIVREDTDNVAPALVCSYGFGDNPSYEFGDCNGSITVAVTGDCGEQGRNTCKVNIRSENPAGLKAKDERTYSIDSKKPFVQDLSPVEGSYVNESQKFELNFSDTTSGVNSSFWNSSTSEKYELQNGTEFQPNWTQSGQKQIKIRINDTAGNILVKKLQYTFDNQKPQIKNFSLLKEKGLKNEVRIYAGESLKFQTNVSDNFEINKSFVEVNGSQSKENISLVKASGNYSQGIWREEVGNRLETGFYNITGLFVEDEAGNIRKLRENLSGFRVVDYGLDLGKDSVLSGYRDSFNLTVDFNRTVGLREFNLTAGGSVDEFELDNVTCMYGGSCNVTENSSYWSISAEGTEADLNLSLDPVQFTPVSDRDVSFGTELQGISKTEELLYRTPEPVVANISCLGGCEVDQFENFTVVVEALNNDTMGHSGEARNVSLLLENSGSGEKYAKKLDNLSSGENTSVQFQNLSIAEANDYRIYANLSEDWTNKYSDRRSVLVEVRDVERPEVVDLSVGGERVNVNESFSVEAVLTDNKEVDSAKLTVQNSSGLEDNITLERSEDVEKQNTWIAGYNKTSVRGVYNLTDLYVSDVNGNYRNLTLNSSFEVSELEMNATLLDDITTVDDPVKFSVNVSGNSEEVSSIEINGTDPDGESLVETYTNVDTTNKLSFNRLSNSGNYSFDVTVSAGSEIEEETQQLEVKYGNSTVRNDNGNSTVLVLPEGESSYNLTWTVTPENGDLEEVTLDMQSSDDTVLQPFEGGSKSIGEVKYEEGERAVGYQAGLANQGKANLTMTVNPGKGGGNSSTLQVHVKASDTSDPVIRNVTQGQNNLNLGEELSLQANATDNSIMENITLKIHHPENGSGVTEVFRMDETSQSIYESVFENSTEEGLYNYSITAWDISGNRHREEGNFTVTDKLDISLDADQEAYVKGEDMEFSLQVRDAGGEQIQDYNVTAKLSKNGTNVTLADGNGLSSFTESIDSSDPPARDSSPNLLPLDYTLYLEVEKGQITEQVTETVGVTRILQVDNKGHTEFIEPGSEFTVWTNWHEPYGQPIEDTIFTSFAVCDACPGNSYERMDQNESTGLYKAKFTAPNSTEDINVRLVGSDNRGNSESQVDSDPTDPIPVVTVELGAQGTESNNTGGAGLPSGGFGGGGGGPSMQIERVSPDVEIDPDKESVELAVNTNIAAQCVYSTNSIPESVSFSEASNFTETGGVNHSASIGLGDRSTYSYSVMCASENVNATSDIIFSTESLDSFTFAAPTSLTPGNESVTQFRNRSGRLVVYNDQNTPVNIGFDIEAECCNLSVVSGSEEVGSVAIPGGGERTLGLKAYAPLFVEPGTYDGTLMLSSVNDSSSHPFSFQVSPNPAVQNFTELRRRAELLNSSISRYRIAGIDTSRMREAFANLTAHLDEANGSIQRNDLEGLESAVREGREDAGSVERMLDDAALKKYVLLNWWKWAAAFVVLYILFFLVVMVGIPYYRIQTELTRINSQLESAVNARKKGEKQYFQRKIDKDTFNEMMTERQNEVLQLRGQKEDLKEELDGFLWKKLTLENYLKAPWKGMNELEKWWAANRRARENLRDGSEEGEE